jgi:transposase
MTRSLTPGWPRRRPATCISPTTPSKRRQLLDAAVEFCAASHVGEVRTLGKTLAAWRPEILAHQATGASVGPTEAMNLLIEKLRRVGHGFKSLRNYRLRW